LARYRTISSPPMYGSMAWDAGASPVIWGTISVAKDVDERGREYREYRRAK